MAEDFETGYQAIRDTSDEEAEETPPGENIIHVVPDKNKARWNHIENLDDFFTRVYQYHQRSGFICMVVQDLLQLIQFGFVVVFSAFLLKCVDYQTLFYERWYNDTSHKVTIGEGIYSTQQCLDRFDPMLVICIVIASLFWLFRLIQCVYSIFLYSEIRAFYLNALKISANELANMTWHEVQQKLLEVQTEQEMCVHKKELNQLDIYHRILRFKNYCIAMTNKQLLPIQYRVPVMGNMVFLTTGLKYNLEMLLFWGPWAPFENYWHLQADYKNYHKRKELAHKLSQKILLVGVANFVLMPLVMLWQILYSFFRYAEIIKREPGTLGMRRWSMYGRLYLRHFNELDHEFNARLNRGYRPAEKYMALFTSPLLSLLAKHVAFISGAVLSVFVILTLIDEDFLQVEHVITVMTILAAVLAVCRACIPDEHLVYCPEFLLKTVLGQIHYMPDSWKGCAHTHKVRDEFAQLYQYKLIYLLQELLSPVVTPFILCFSFRHRSLAVVDFFRNFSVEVTGVGDVCSFAQMDIRKHGNPQWVPEDATEASHSQQAEGGKTELSLMHFTLTNPTWRPPRASVSFMSHLKEQVQRDATMMSLQPLDNPLANSLHSLASVGYTSLMSSGANTQTDPGRSSLNPGLQLSTRTNPPPILRGVGLKNAEGPVTGGATKATQDTLVSGLLSSLQMSDSTPTSPGMPPQNQQMSFQQQPPGYSIQPFAAVAAANNMALSQSFSMNPLIRPGHAFNSNLSGGMSRNTVDEETLEFLSMEMSFSALYMHELHHRRLQYPLNPYFDENADGNADEDSHARALWKVPEDESASSGPWSLQQGAGMMRRDNSAVQPRREGNSRVFGKSSRQATHEELNEELGDDSNDHDRDFITQGSLILQGRSHDHHDNSCLRAPQDIELHPLSASDVPDIPSLPSHQYNKPAHTTVTFGPTSLLSGDESLTSTLGGGGGLNNQTLPATTTTTQGPYGRQAGLSSSASGGQQGRSVVSPPPSGSDSLRGDEGGIMMMTSSQKNDGEKQPLIGKDDSLHEL